MQEISGENSTLLEKLYRTTAILYLALLFSTILLIAVSRLFNSETKESFSPNTATTLWVVVIFVAVASFVLRRVLYRWERLRDVRLLRGFTGVCRTLQVNSIILAVMAETISVIGFIITAAGGEKADMLRAGLVSLIIFIINLPRKSVWKKIASSLEKV